MIIFFTSAGPSLLLSKWGHVNFREMSLKVSRILHAGYVFEYEGIKIAFDPIFENPFSRNCHAFPSVKFDYEQIRELNFDAVFISHYHDDHCSLESLNYLDRKTSIYMYCLFEEMFSLMRKLGFENVFPLELNRPVRIASIDIIPRRALDAEVDSLFQIKAGGLNILNVVDSWIDYTTLDLLVREGPWDMVLWPFQTMREIDVLSPLQAPEASLQLPPEWIEQLVALKPRYVVPSSCQFIQEEWSWYNHFMFPITYKQFQKEVEAALPKAEVVRMNPSVSVTLSKNSVRMSAPLTWVQPVGEQDVDYEYKKDLVIPTTAEVARHFAALTEEQTQRVLRYCNKDLIEKYKSMNRPLDDYFSTPRLWSLSLYNHRGEAERFYYRLEDNQMELVTAPQEPVSWRTEVPIARLYGALEWGESLTSMYMRIDPVDSSVDILEDPLVRCLFNGVFGAYQKAQLARL